MEISKSKSIEEKAYEFEVKLSESLAIVLCSNNIQISSLNCTIEELSHNNSGSGKLSEEKAKVSKLQVYVSVLEKRTELAERSLKEAKDNEIQVFVSH